MSLVSTSTALTLIPLVVLAQPCGTAFAAGQTAGGGEWELP
jgi:hypothetical protein